MLDPRFRAAAATVVADDAAWLDSVLQLLAAAGLDAVGAPAFDGLPRLDQGAAGGHCLVIGLAPRHIDLALGLLRSRSAGEAAVPAILLAAGPLEPRLVLAALRAGAWDLCDVGAAGGCLPALVRRAISGGPPDGMGARPAALAALPAADRHLLRLLLAGRTRRSISRRLDLDGAALDQRWIEAGRLLGAEGHLGALRAARDAGLRPAV